MMNDGEKSAAAAAAAVTTLLEGSDTVEQEASHLEAGTDLQAAAVEDVPDDLPRDADDSTTNDDDDGGNSEISSTSSDAAPIEVQLDNDEDRSGNDEGALLYGSTESNENFHPTAQAVYPEVVANHRIQQEVAERKKNIAVAEMVVTNEEAQVPHPHESFNQKNCFVSLCNTRKRLIIVSVLTVAIVAVVIAVSVTMDSGFGSAPTRPTLAPTQAPTKLSLLDLLQRESLGNGSELLDSSTYQYQAMAWLETIDHESLTDDAILQKFALVCIFYATYEKRTLYTDAVYGYDAAPPGWNRTDNWLSQENECTWFGISCNNNGKVNDIELYSNSLTGSFPPEVVYLNQSLKALDLYDNVIWNQGDPGHAWLEQMTNLQYLFYGNTFFQYDGIPTYIGALTNLIKYDCSTTLYFGDLRGEIFQNLQNLTYLVMGDNSYNMATVPSQIINLPKLQYLYMHNCDLQGNLAFMKHFTQMQEFRIDKNLGIKGSIPSQIGQLSDSLVTFSASDCSLSGSIPSELGLLTNMQKIWLSGNSITGRVPTEIGHLKKLEVLEVYDNGLQGRMPIPVCNLVVPSSNGGNLTALVADCKVLNCTCCTSCK